MRLALPQTSDVRSLDIGNGRLTDCIAIITTSIPFNLFFNRGSVILLHCRSSLRTASGTLLIGNQLNSGTSSRASPRNSGPGLIIILYQCSCRAKYEKLRKGGTETSEEEEKPPQFEAEEMNFGVFQGQGTAPASVLTWKQGRELLRQYLQEIGFTDTMIDVRSTRIQTLLGLQVSFAMYLRYE